jgi:Transposase DDE domain
MLSVRTVSRHLHHLLTTTADEAARATGCVRRTRRFTGATLCQTLVLGWLGTPGATLDQLCQMAAACGVRIRPQGLARRFTPAASEMLKQVLDAAIEQVLATEPVTLSLLQRFAGVYLQDCTVITLPPALTSVWSGCGDATEDGHTAVLKLGVRLDLLHGTLHGPVLAAGRTHDRRAVDALPALPAHSLRLADLGFFSLRDLAAQDRAGCYWLTRLQAGTAVFLSTGHRWELATLLARQGTGLTEWAVEVGVTERLACRLIAVPVPAAVADQRRRRMKDEARRRGQAVTADRLRLASFTVLLSNVPPDLLTPAEALVLARARWQIELLFKCWKSDGQIDTWRSQQPDRILCEVYAKLIGLIIQQWVLLTSGWEDPRRSLRKAATAVRTAAFTLALTIRQLRRLTATLRALALPLQAGARLQTRRAHPSTSQLLEHPDLNYDPPLAA